MILYQAINKNKNYFLQIEPFVHINLKNNSCIFYNTLNKENVIINNSLILNFITELLDKENFRILECKQLLSDKVFIDFVETIKRKQMGNIIVQENKKNKPIQIPPDIIIDNDISAFKEDEPKLIDDIRHYIHKINITINNGMFSNQKKLYFNYYKQFDSPLYDDDKYKELPLDKIIHFFDTLDYLPQQIIINGGNIFSYNNFEKLISYLNKKETLIIYQIDINDFVLNKGKINIFNKDNSLLRIYINSMEEVVKLEKIQDLANISYHFIINSIDDFKDFNKVVEKLKIRNYSFNPYYNEKNINFFMNNIAVNFDDIISQNENINTIESKAKYNPKLFGNVYIDNFGHIRLHPTSSSIGKISDNLYLQIFKEFVHNKKNVWFLTRNDVEPCKNCNFALLCPAISGYEIYSGKYNFCTIKQ